MIPGSLDGMTRDEAYRNTHAIDKAERERSAEGTRQEPNYRNECLRVINFAIGYLLADSLDESQILRLRNILIDSSERIYRGESGVLDKSLKAIK